MKVIRVIQYESDDQGRMDRQLEKSLPDGRQPGWCTAVTVHTVPQDSPLFATIEAEIEAKYQK